LFALSLVWKRENLILPLQAAAASITETHGSLDLLINSTGILSIPNVIQPGGFSASYHVWAQHPKFSKHQFPSTLSETKFPASQRLH
jgi:hypothetical protein